MNSIEEINQILQKKYAGYVRTIQLNFIEHGFAGCSSHEINNSYILTWRPWVFESMSMLRMTEVYTFNEKYGVIISKELIEYEGIESVFPKIDATIEVSDDMAKILKNCKYAVRMPMVKS